MSDATAAHTASPVVHSRASFKRLAALLAQPAAARSMKRPSKKCLSAATQAKRLASDHRGATIVSTHGEDEHDEEAIVEAPSMVPPAAATAHEDSAGGAGAGADQSARAEYHPLAVSRPLLMLMDDGNYMNTKGEACDEFGHLLRRRGAKEGYKIQTVDVVGASTQPLGVSGRCPGAAPRSAALVERLVAFWQSWRTLGLVPVGGSSTRGLGRASG